jgi:hypothetical protein
MYKIKLPLTQTVSPFPIAVVLPPVMPMSTASAYNTIVPGSLRSRHRGVDGVSSRRPHKIEVAVSVDAQSLESLMLHVIPYANSFPGLSTAEMRACV